MRNVMVLALAALLAVLIVLPACGGLKGLQEGYVKAEAIQPSVDAVVERHNGIMDGSINMADYTAEQKAGFVLEGNDTPSLKDSYSCHSQSKVLYS